MVILLGRLAAWTRVGWGCEWEGWLTAEWSPPQAESDNLWQPHRLRGGGVGGRGGAVVKGRGVEGMGDGRIIFYYLV